jgi:CRP-like cAMP-binding protein
LARLPLISPLERALFLKAQPYLEGLPSRAIAGLAEYSEERSFKPGDVVYRAGEAPDRVYFLASGSVRTEYPGAPPFELEAPCGIGIIEHLVGSRVPPAVSAIRETFALSVRAAELFQLIEDDFGHYATLTRGLSRALLEELAGAAAARRVEGGFRDTQQRVTYAAVDLVHRIALAREAPFFAGSNLTVMTELLRFQEPRILGAGELLWDVGSAVESLALVLDGEILTWREGAETAQPPGSMLGAWEVFSVESRREGARAKTAARIIEIDRTHFADVLEDHFAFAIDYLSKLCRRLLELRFGQPELGSGR